MPDISMLFPGNSVTIVPVAKTKQDSSKPLGVQLNEEITSYESGIYDIEDETILILMPVRAGKIIVLDLAPVYEFKFTTGSGMYKAEGKLTKREKRGNFYLLHVHLLATPKKFQRRDYYRMPCTEPLIYIRLDDEIGESKDPSDIRQAKEIAENSPMKGRGMALDISGSGMRFSASGNFTDSKYIFVHLTLGGNGEPFEFEVVAKVIAIEPMANSDLYMYRVKFLYHDEAMQETIVKYIFDTERKSLRKGQ